MRMGDRNPCARYGCSGLARWQSYDPVMAVGNVLVMHWQKAVSRLAAVMWNVAFKWAEGFRSITIEHGFNYLEV